MSEDIHAPTSSTGKRKTPPTTSCSNSTEPIRDSTTRGEVTREVAPPSRTAEQQHDDEEVWTHEIHRAFVAAVFHLGLKHSSPSVILENMSQTPAVLTSERIKSHLQKFRKNKTKAKEDFMEEYDSFLKRAITVGDVGPGATNSGLAGDYIGRIAMSPPGSLQMMGMNGKASGGAGIAAYLTYLDMVVGDRPDTESADTIELDPPKSLLLGDKNAQEMFAKQAGSHLKIPFPDLTEKERQSPLGVSLLYAIGCISSLTQHLVQERVSRKVSLAVTGAKTSQEKSTELPEQVPTTPDVDATEAKWKVGMREDTLYVEDRKAAVRAAYNKTVSQMHKAPPGQHRRQISAVDFPMNHRQYGGHYSRMRQNPPSNNGDNQSNNESDYLDDNELQEHPSRRGGMRPESPLIFPAQGNDTLPPERMLLSQDRPQQLSPRTGAQLAFYPTRETTEQRRPSSYGFFQPIPDQNGKQALGRDTSKSPLMEVDSDGSPTEEWFSEV